VQSIAGEGGLLKISKPILVVLIFAIVVVAYLFFSGGKKPTPAVPPQVVAPQGPAAQAPIAPPVPPKVSSVGSKPDMLRPGVTPTVYPWRDDPFKLPASVESTPGEGQKTAMKLVAILEGKGGRVAVINQDVLGQGDSILGERVFAIGPDRVILTKANTQRVLTLSDPIKEKKEAGLEDIK
jgi:hypothetical protein